MSHICCRPASWNQLYLFLHGGTRGSGTDLPGLTWPCNLSLGAHSSLLGPSSPFSGFSFAQEVSPREQGQAVSDEWQPRVVRLLVLPSGNGGISEPQFSKAHLAVGGKLGRTCRGPLSVDTTADVKQLKKLGMFNLGKERLGPRRPLFQRLRAGSWRWVAWLWVALEWGLPGDRILPKSQFSFICQLYLSDDPTMR